MLYEKVLSWLASLTVFMVVLSVCLAFNVNERIAVIVTLTAWALSLYGAWRLLVDGEE